MNWAGTWAARRVVESTKMEVSCILGGGFEKWMLFYTVGLISRLLLRAGVVGVDGVDGVGGGEMIEGELNAMADFLLFFKHWSLARGVLGWTWMAFLNCAFEECGMYVYGALGPMVGQVMQRLNGRRRALLRRPVS
jgi:hypothetical protein